MRAFLAIIALVGCLASEECNCPAFVHDLANGKQVFASDGPGHVVISPCCQSLLSFAATTQKNSTTGNLTAVKQTPGGSCSGLADCKACTVLEYCAWSSVSSKCAEPISLEADSAAEYSHSCDGPTLDYFEGAEIVDPKVNKTVVPIDKDVFSEKPHVAFAPNEWPADFGGYLPPHGCPGGLSAMDFKQKYPSGLPGCSLYTTEEANADPMHVPTDMVTDPRLPVETHMPNYPLGANPHLPDHMVGGGDWNMPQPTAAWIAPHFNDNGCFGGPCDTVHRSAQSELLSPDHPATAPVRL